MRHDRIQRGSRYLGPYLPRPQIWMAGTQPREVAKNLLRDIRLHWGRMDFASGNGVSSHGTSVGKRRKLRRNTVIAIGKLS